MGRFLQHCQLKLRVSNVHSLTFFMKRNVKETYPTETVGNISSRKFVEDFMFQLFKNLEEVQKQRQMLCNVLQQWKGELILHNFCYLLLLQRHPIKSEKPAMHPGKVKHCSEVTFILTWDFWIKGDWKSSGKCCLKSKHVYLFWI